MDGLLVFADDWTPIGAIEVLPEVVSQQRYYRVEEELPEVCAPLHRLSEIRMATVTLSAEYVWAPNKSKRLVLVATSDADRVALVDKARRWTGFQRFRLEP